MRRIPELREIPILPDESVNAAANGDLVFFVGAGLSRLVGMPSWGQMALSQLEDLRQRGLLNYSELDQLKNLDPKKQLSITREIADDNDISLDYTKGLRDTNSANNIYNIINAIGCVCVTTNYDEMLNPIYYPCNSSDRTKSSVNRIYEKTKFLASHLNKPGSVIHLHGSISDQSSMVVTTKDYLEHYDDAKVKSFLHELFERKTILFLGYGLEESEILEHILRRGDVHSRSERKRFALQGFYHSQLPLYSSLLSYYEKSFGVHILGFVRDFKDYNQQEAILDDWRKNIDVRDTTLASEFDLLDKVLNND